jgi:hypothetical protein
MLKLAKLTTREFVIGRLSQNLLINVFIINFKTDNLSGSVGINLVPYMAPLDNTLSPVISIDKAVCVLEPSQELAQQYILAASKYIEEAKKEFEKSTQTSQTVQEPIREILNDNVSEIN